jgi:hypothetical protein
MNAEDVITTSNPTGNPNVNGDNNTPDQDL